MSIKALMNYTFVSKYARWSPDKKRRETWNEAVDRVKQMMLDKYASDESDHNHNAIKEQIELAYDAMRKKKILGSQRALQFGGSPIFAHNSRIYNCTASYIDRPRFFQECMYLLLCGCGTGFSVQRHHVEKLPNLLRNKNGQKKFVIQDSIEGWSDAVGVLVCSYFDKCDLFSEYAGKNIVFDFSQIRPAGSFLKSSGGKAPGPEPLKKALSNIKKVLDKAVKSGQEKLKPIDTYDIVMFSADAVISGGVRRSATICVFSADDEEMAKAKTGSWFVDNPQRGRSNNSALLIRNETTKEQFEKLMDSVKEFGEPGFVWSDSKELIVNPCVEISMYPVDEVTGLTGWQACNLSTINCAKVKTKEDFLAACEAAAIIGTLQAGFTEFPYLGDVSERIVAREALLGVSMTGVMERHDICLDPEVQKLGAEIVKSTNKHIADLISIRQSARTTCIKPEGCLNKETITISNHGILSLEEIGDIYGDTWQELEDMKFSTDTQMRTGLKFFVNGVKETKKILTSGGIEVEATHNHKFRVLRNGEYIWVEAKDLVRGDVMPYKLNTYNGGNYQSLLTPSIEISIHATRLNKDISLPSMLDENFSWFLGLYTGDGSNHENKYSIRIHGDIRKQEHLIRAKEYLSSLDISSKVVKYNDDPNDNRCALYVTSRLFYEFLRCNGLLKNKSKNISIPLLVRKSPKSVISSFINGYCAADGCEKGRTRSFCTTSKTMANQLVQCLRAIGIEAAMRLMPPTNSSYGTSMRYWVQERVGRSGNTEKSKYHKEYEQLNSLGMHDFAVDVILDITDSFCDTYDISIDHEDHTYIANSYVSHNTSSCILGTSSGIHPHHAKRYIRRVQANKMEPIYQYFRKINPRACEESVWSNNDSDDVVSFCVEVPDGSKIKNQVSAIELLEFVKSTQQNWVIAGTNKHLCTQPWLTHNVSNTINVKPEEWESVTDFIYENRNYFCGISLLPIAGDKDYAQAPFTTIYLPSEQIQHYGDAVLFVSGLIEVGLRLYDDNLWAACDSLLGIGQKIKGTEKKDYLERCQRFANKYLNGDLKKLTYCMKDVYNYKNYIDIIRENKDVDYTEVIEEIDSTNLQSELACSGGSCEII